MKAILYVSLLVLIGCNKPLSDQTVVGIQSYDGFPAEKTEAVANAIADFYKVRTIVLPKIKLYPEAFINVKSPRYRADSIIRIQKKKIPDSIDFILGLTDKDISTTKKDEHGHIRLPVSKYNDWGIMGLGYRPGKSCVVSTFRLKSNSKARHFSRLRKVAVHEFGHNLGLAHCPDKKCVMTDAVESIATIDYALLELCKVCQSQVGIR